MSKFYGRVGGFLTRCQSCHNTTTKAFAREHYHLCKVCYVGEALAKLDNRPTRNERLLEVGYLNYALEENHFEGDQP